METNTEGHNLDSQKDADSRPVHGSITTAELRMLGLRSEDVLDFSASISPIGPPKGVWEAMQSVDLATYPDPECLELREAISRHVSTPGFQIPIDRIQVGNGSTEIFHLIARAYLSGRAVGPAKAFLLTPTYGEYAGACRAAGARVVSLEARPDAGFHWDLNKLVGRIQAEAPNVIFVCSPNNPTGVYLDRQELNVLAEEAGRAGGFIVVDEAYLSFVPGPWDSISLLERDNVVLVRSMTKNYALTGLRLGYAIGPQRLIDRLRALQPDWSVNSLAQRAGIAALVDTAYLPLARKTVFESKEFLAPRLSVMGLNVLHSEANFLLVAVGNATAWRTQLLKRSLVVRDCTSFGLPVCVRIGLRLLPDCRTLADAIEELIVQPGLAPQGRSFA